MCLPALLEQRVVKLELGDVFSIASSSIGDANLPCRCSQNGKPCLMPILLADVVSVCSKVVRYHDGLLIVDVFMYAGGCRKAGMRTC
jgi:hypothetical protein